MNLHPQELLKWYLLSGVDDVLEETPVNRLEAGRESRVMSHESKPSPGIDTISPTNHSPTHNSRPKTQDPGLTTPVAAIATARAQADTCNDLASLRAAVESFDGCALKRTAGKTVFCDGNPKAQVMFIGEAPGAQEDIQGIPFCGASGALLDKMLASIGLTRAENAYITNTIFWRPPGNRQPSPEETSICRPFVEKHIALMNPKLLVLVGGTATKAVLGTETGITKLRGKFYSYKNDYMLSDVPVGVIYHPSYLLRQPLTKKQAWHDLLMIKDKMTSLGIS